MWNDGLAKTKYIVSYSKRIKWIVVGSDGRLKLEQREYPFSEICLGHGWAMALIQSLKAQPTKYTRIRCVKMKNQG